MTQRNVRKQGWVFLFVSPDFDDRLNLNFHRFVVLHISCDTQSVGLGQYCLPKVSNGFKTVPFTKEKMARCPCSYKTHKANRTDLIPLNTNLHNIKQCLLSRPVFLLEEVVLRVRPGNIPSDDLLARRRHLEILCVFVLEGRVESVALQLPHYAPEVMGNA